MRSLALGSVLIALGSAAFAAGPVPRPATAIDFVESSTGKHIALSNYKGKVVVVQFLLTTCPHCQVFSQILTRLQAEYGPKGFQALGAAVNEATPEMAKEYGAKYAQGFPVGPFPHDTAIAFMGMSVMERPGFPQIAVIDRKGQIREQTTSENIRQPLQDEAHLRALVEKLLAENVGAPAKSGAAVTQKSPSTVAATK
jgi:thiol-disulfide isomerase/thioredoxin